MSKKAIKKHDRDDDVQRRVREFKTRWDRNEYEPCQAGTIGCSVDHVDDEPCETW